MVESLSAYKVIKCYRALGLADHVPCLTTTLPVHFLNQYNQLGSRQGSKPPAGYFRLEFNLMLVASHQNSYHFGVQDH